MGELDSLIHFWQEFLKHNRPFMEPSIIYQIEQTIRNLTELNQLRRRVK